MASWQAKYEKLTDRVKYLLNDETLSDCTFLVGSDKNKTIIKGHKFLLAIASPVFEAMFYGSQKIYYPIPVLDVDPKVFKSLLEYIYTESVKLDDLDSVFGIYYAAEKYMLPYLCSKCVNHLRSVLQPVNVCNIYEFAKLFDETDLKDSCMKMIETQTKEALVNDNFIKCRIETVVDIFQKDKLNVSEMDLFHAAVRYSYKLKAEQKSEMNESQRKTENLLHGTTSTPTQLSVRNIIQNIRFLTFTPQEFANGPADSNLLTKDEIYSILMNILSFEGNHRMPEGFSGSKISRNLSYQQARVNGSIFDSHSNNFQFQRGWP